MHTGEPKKNERGQGVFRLAYVSLATDALTADEMKKLEVQSQRANAELNVTGLLILDGGRILQVLEGSEKTVKELFRKIAQDPRHREVKLFAGDWQAKAMLHSWSMVAGEISNAPQSVKRSFLEMHDRFFSGQALVGILPDEVESLKMISLFQALPGVS